MSQPCFELVACGRCGEPVRRNRNANGSLRSLCVACSTSGVSASAYREAQDIARALYAIFDFVAAPDTQPLTPGDTGTSARLKRAQGSTTE